jgi:hypothetical protein
MSTFLMVMLTAAPTMGFTDKEMFTWVSGELNIENRYKMPAIQYVTKEKLSHVFKKNNERSFKRWTSEYGEEKATELIDFYLCEVIGLFIPKTGDLYVGDFIEPCKKESIVAHELTHFFQHMKDGPVDPNSKDAANKHLYREMQGGNIEKKFMEKFCRTADSIR